MYLRCNYRKHNSVNLGIFSFKKNLLHLVKEAADKRKSGKDVIPDMRVHASQMHCVRNSLKMWLCFTRPRESLLVNNYAYYIDLPPVLTQFQVA